MPKPVAQPVDADITVTTATQSEADIRQQLGVAEPDAADATPPAPEGDEKPKGEAPDDGAEFDAAIDTIEPPKPDETPAQKTARQSRGKKKILKEIALRKQAEDKAAELQRRLDAALRPPAPSAPAAGMPKSDAPIADGSSSAPSFEFPTFEQWQDKNPGKVYEDYTDARTDARVAWNRDIDRATAERASTARRFSESLSTFQREETDFKTAHPDYDEKLTAINLVDLGGAAIRNDANGHPVVVQSPQWQLAQARLHQIPKDAPAILYYLATHPTDAKRLFQAESPADLIDTLAEIRVAVRSAAKDAREPATPDQVVPAAAAPARPIPAAPAPLSAVRGAADPRRTLQQLADDEDADAYIAERTRELRAS